MKRSSFIFIFTICSMVAFAQVGVFTGAVSVGDDGGIGEASFAGGTYTVMGSGSDIWNNADGLYWIY